MCKTRSEDVYHALMEWKYVEKSRNARIWILKTKQVIRENILSILYKLMDMLAKNELILSQLYGRLRACKKKNLSLRGRNQTFYS